MEDELGLSMSSFLLPSLLHGASPLFPPTHPPGRSIQRPPPSPPHTPRWIVVPAPPPPPPHTLLVHDGPAGQQCHPVPLLIHLGRVPRTGCTGHDGGQVKPEESGGGNRGPHLASYCRHTCAGASVYCAVHVQVASVFCVVHVQGARPVYTVQYMYRGTV